VEHPEHFERAAYVDSITGEALLAKIGQTGADQGMWYLSACNNQEIGMSSLLLGGGRQTKDSPIDLTVGIELECHLGDRVLPNQVVARLYANDINRLAEARERFVAAYSLSQEKPEPRPVVYEIITK
jgi:pyrimidine-nucleoside phosphorylase